VGFLLVPESHRRDIVLKREISPARVPAQSLDGHPEVFLEPHRVRDVPAVESEALLGLPLAVRDDDLRHARIGSCVFPVFPFHGESVGSAEVVLGPGAADGGKLLVSVDEKFYLAFTPPAGVVRAPAHVGADKVAPAFDSINDGVNGLVGQGIDAPELGMQIACILWDVGQGVVDLIIEGHVFLVQVLHGDLARFPERHHPVAVEAASGIHADGQGGDLSEFSPAAGEKIPHRDLHGWFLFPVPVEPEDREAPVAGRRHPDLLDGSRALYICQDKRLLGLDDDIGRNFPALAQVSGGFHGRPVDRHPSFAFLAAEVLGADGAALGMGQAEQVSEVEIKTVKRFFLLRIEHHCRQH